MHKATAVKRGITAALLFTACSVSAQSGTGFAIQELGNLVNDAIFFTDKYITPATDAAVYQAASSWMYTPKKSELWNFTLGIHANAFLVPERDRKFTISNSNFSFFTIDGAATATTPSAIGSDKYVNLSGMLDGKQVVLRSPEGINREVVVYPYIQGSLGLLYGTELVVKFAPRTTLKTVEYQVYGFGLKHNISQYFKSLEQKKIHIAVLAAYSKEDISVNFLDVQTEYGSLGLNSLNSLIDTWQLQLNASREFERLELSAGFIMNTSDFEYKVDGAKGTIEEIIPLQQILNTKLKEIAKTKSNYIGEIAARYQFNHFYIQTSIAFGKFVNSNLSFQYEFKQKNKKQTI